MRWMANEEKKHESHIYLTSLMAEMEKSYFLCQLWALP